MAYFVYILQADDGTYYVGQTNDLKDRLNRHNSGRVKSTKAKAPWRLVYTEELATRAQATKREKQIKGAKSRENIARLVRTSRDSVAGRSTTLYQEWDRPCQRL